jgi:DNA-binding PadR family transcriptional regulator
MPKTLGDFETLILLALVRLKDQAYGATIHREIETRTNRSIAIGAVYTGLARLQRSGHLTATIGEPTPERGGRRKKYYCLEPDGAAALSQALQAHERMREGIEEDLEVLTARDSTDS